MGTKAIERHFVDFYSPGTFVCEQSRRPIASWDTAAAVELANGITERHSAKPFGFRFATCLVADPIPDGQGGTLNVEPKEIKKSGLHYLGGKLLLYDDIPRTEDTRILLSNMSGNCYPICIENRNSWRYTGYFDEDDCIVDADGSITRRGTDADLAEYRKRKVAEWSEARP